MVGAGHSRARGLAAGVLLWLLLWTQIATAQPAADEPGLIRGEPRVTLRAPSGPGGGMSLQAAYTHGFHEGLGWAGIMGGPQIILWGVPFYWFASELEATSVPAMLYLAIPSTVFGLSAIGVGIWQIATHRQGELPTGQHRSVYNRALVKGMGLGILATGALNLTLSGLLLFYGGEEIWGGDEEFGDSMNTGLFIAGGVELLVGGAMTLVGHLAADKIMSRRVTLSPLVLPGGGGLVLGGRW